MKTRIERFEDLLPGDVATYADGKTEAYSDWSLSSKYAEGWWEGCVAAGIVYREIPEPVIEVGSIWRNTKSRRLWEVLAMTDTHVELQVGKWSLDYFTGAHEYVCNPSSINETAPQSVLNSTHTGDNPQTGDCVGVATKEAVETDSQWLLAVIHINPGFAESYRVRKVKGGIVSEGVELPELESGACACIIHANPYMGFSQGWDAAIAKMKAKWEEGK